jgi:hypothetical protein
LNGAEIVFNPSATEETEPVVAEMDLDLAEPLP